MSRVPGGIGILGGTFNPIHLGHLRAAEEVRTALGLDEMRLVPAAIPPHKDAGPIVEARHRLRMVELAIAGVPGFRAWDVELGRSGPSYSVDTLRALRAEVGDTARIVFVLGRDAFAGFGTWREYPAIFALCDLVVMTRPPWPPELTIDDFPVAAQGSFGYDPARECYRHASGHGVSLQRITALDISATAIRANVAAQHSIRFLVPPAVEQYIAAEQLYRSEHSTI
ncbi:MAG TPA: nicotinate-nucleotide adenylyltransferase [Candidatus Binatia bacterium]|nr:nicotinate-nucleotide adenylyltransferase [Candidatus Binatia bacterium]